MAFLQRTMNRGSVSTGYDIDNSLKVEADNSEYAEYAITSTTDRRNFCFSGWVKRTELVNATDGGQLIFASFTEGNEGVLLRWSRENSSYYDGIQVDIGQGGTNYRSYTSSLYRDTSAWYHIVLAVNTRENTASDRWKLYVNGEQVTSWAQQQFPTADFLTSANLSGSKHTIGAYETGGTVYGKNCGYFADFHFIDADGGNVTFLPTDFGETDEDSGIWKPKAYTGSYGTNGFYLDFESSGSLGADSSGNSNNFTLNNITAADQATDTPTNNFATMNVLWGNDNMPLMSEGATEFGNNVSAYRYAVATMGVTSGKWYWEIKPTVNGNTLVSGAGIASNENTLFFYDETGNFVYHYDGDRYVNGTAVSSYGTAWSTNDIIGFAYDADNWTLTCYVNNSSQGNLLASQTDISSELFIPYVYSFGTHTYQCNFGGYTNMSNAHTNTDENGYGSFVYAPPTGYYALCGKNLAEFGGTA